VNTLVPVNASCPEDARAALHDLLSKTAAVKTVESVTLETVEPERPFARVAIDVRGNGTRRCYLFAIVVVTR
jgi:hypothetical protein